MKNSEIIADKAHPYSLEVISHIGENTFTYDPSSLSWSIEDPTVCKIENGILTGIKNGTTNITGSIGNFSGNMKVTVEIPESPKNPGRRFFRLDYKIHQLHHRCRRYSFGEQSGHIGIHLQNRTTPIRRNGQSDYPLQYSRYLAHANQ